MKAKMLEAHLLDLGARNVKEPRVNEISKALYYGVCHNHMVVLRH